MKSIKHSWRLSSTKSCKNCRWNFCESTCSSNRCGDPHPHHHRQCKRDKEDREEAAAELDGGLAALAAEKETRCRTMIIPLTLKMTNNNVASLPDRIASKYNSIMQSCTRNISQMTDVHCEYINLRQITCINMPAFKRRERRYSFLMRMINDFLRDIFTKDVCMLGKFAWKRRNAWYKLKATFFLQHV